MDASTPKRRDGSLDGLLAALQPRNELAEYSTLALGAGLFPQFAAVVAGLRPGMDCWIPCRNLEVFRRFVQRLGLAMAIDCAFRELPAKARDQVVGIETLCTTHAIGVRLQDAAEDDSAHVFVAHDQAAADRLRACGWYPVVIEGRLSHKPFVDHLQFGRLLGYPACCIEFFKTGNNWNRTNSYAEAYLNTEGGCDHRTNCFGKNLGYSLNFHIPCRFDCAETIAFSARLLDYLRRAEPDYAAACRRLLRKPVLSLNERETVVLDAVRIRGDRVTYRGARNLFSAPERLLAALAQGDAIELRGRFAMILRGADVIETLECRCDEFGPRVPLLVKWA